jgi:hypothetical protein
MVVVADARGHMTAASGVGLAVVAIRGVLAIACAGACWRPDDAVFIVELRASTAGAACGVVGGGVGDDYAILVVLLQLLHCAGWCPTVVAGGQRVTTVDIGACASSVVRHTAISNACVVGWQAAPTFIDGR